VIEVEVTGQKELTDAFNKLLQRAGDLRPFWPQVARVFWEAERKLFDASGAGNWVPLSPAYAARKMRHYPSAGILERSGDLRRSLVGPFSPGAVYLPQPDSLLLGTTVPYASIHHEGATLRTGPRKAPKPTKSGKPRKLQARPAARGILPRRPPIIMTETDEQAMLDVARAGFKEFAESLGFEVK
jgi:phage gpG-like protein